MRNLPVFRAAALTFAGCWILTAVPALTPPGGTIGSNLEAFANVQFSEAVPADGLPLTITSDDESRLLFSEAPETRGTKTLTLKVSGGQSQSPEFYIQAFGAPGAATYKVSAPGFGTAKGTITIAPSTITIGGPSDSGRFRTTNTQSRKITVRTAYFDDHGKIVGSQPLAGGLTAKIDISSSNPTVGAASPASVVLRGGTETLATEFQPGQTGQTVLTATLPRQFANPPNPGNVTIDVEEPGIGLLMDVSVGKDLQVQGDVMLGADAPKDGLDVTLRSQDPKRLVLSTRDDVLGSGSITLHIPAGQGLARYWVQGLGDSGVVHYTAEARGYRTRDAAIQLSPSGMMVVFTPFGPPDEQQYLHPMPNPNARPFVASLAEHKKLWLSVWSVYLDPTSLRGADITAQKLRPGISVPVQLKNSNPAVAQVSCSLTMTSQNYSVRTEFQPLTQGETTISIDTPPGFSKPSNATSVTAFVKP